MSVAPAAEGVEDEAAVGGGEEGAGGGEGGQGGGDEVPGGLVAEDLDDGEGGGDGYASEGEAFMILK